MTRPRLLPSLLVWTLCAGTAFASTPEPAVTDAPSLARIAREALSRASLAAAADPRVGALDPALSAPLWSALQAGAQALAEVEAGIGRPSPDLFRAIGEASRRVAEVSASWTRLGLGPGPVTGELRTLGSAWAVFRGTYGPEGVRHRSGEPLSPDEALRLEALRRAEERFAERLAVLEARARRDRQAREAERLAALRRKAESLAREVADLDGYLATLAGAAELDGEWRSARAAAPTVRRRSYAEVDPIVEEITTESEAGSVFVVDLSRGQTWKFLEQSTEIPADFGPTAEAAGEPGDAERVDGEFDGPDETEPLPPTSLEPGDDPRDEPDERAADGDCAEDDEECLAERRALGEATNGDEEGAGEPEWTPTAADPAATPEPLTRRPKEPSPPGTACNNPAAAGCTAVDPAPVPATPASAAPPPRPR